ncbi:MAG: nucleotidyltransferase domain-containing protein [Candidatus Lutacidiplasmatales archaeon]
MRLHEALNPILGSPYKLGLLRTMFASPDRHWTGRELARAARVSAAQGARDLGELADTSLVSREVVGKSYSWRLNPSHALTSTLTELFLRESGLRSEMLRTLSEGLRTARVDRARVFGSIPRGEERDDSDVDLFLQIRTSGDREKAEAAVDKVRSEVWNRFGNPVSAIIYTRAEVARPRSAAFLKAIEQEGLDVTR